MTFDEKVKFLRKLPKFMVIPINEVRALSFAAQEKNEPNQGDFMLGRTENRVLTLTSNDIEKILREYPDLEAKLR